MDGIKQHKNHEKGKVYLLGAGPGDPGLITVKAAEILMQAEVIICDDLVNKKLLEYCDETCEIIFIGKSRSENRLTQDEINRLMVYHAKTGRLVARLKGGDPFIFGRGGEEAEFLTNAGIEWYVVPGVSSGIAVPAYAAIPLTHRKFSSGVAFITAHKYSGFQRRPNLAAIASSVDTLVIFMGALKIEQIVTELLESELPASTPIAVVENGTFDSERITVGKLSSITTKINSAEINTPALIIIGDVVNLRGKIYYNPNQKIRVEDENKKQRLFTAFY